AEPGSPPEVVRDGVLELRARGDLHDPLVELGRGSEAARVPWAHLSEHAAAVFLPEDLDHEVEVPAHEAEAFVEVRFRGEFAGVKVMTGAPEDPWIVEGAAPDADARAAGDLEH